MIASLFKLFNVGFYDFARPLPDDHEDAGLWEGLEWPTNATHRLVPGYWNHDKLWKPNGKGAVQKPDGFALSVCAVPLTRKFRLRGKLIKVRASLPPMKERPVYMAKGDIEGKRNVLHWMVRVQRAKVSARTINKASYTQLDTIYRNLLQADTYRR